MSEAASWDEVLERVRVATAQRARWTAEQREAIEAAISASHWGEMPAIMEASGLSRERLTQIRTEMQALGRPTGSRTKRHD